MTHTLRRSKSKYARTRRQHKKQRRIRGGGFGFLNDVGNTIVGAFKPSTPAEKCRATRKAAQEACSNVEGDIEMMEITSDTDASSPVGEGTTSLGEYGASSSTKPIGDGNSSSTSSSTIPVGDGISSSTTPVGDGNSSGSGEELPSGSSEGSPSTTSLDKVLPSGSGEGLYSAAPSEEARDVAAAAAGGGAKKSKKKNKKRSQSRRKKLKSRKHKK
jgi:hypothetical protein